MLPIIYFLLKKKDFKKELGFFSNGLKKDLKNTIVLLLALIVFSMLISYVAGFAGLNDLGKVAKSIDQIKTTAPLALWYFLIVRVSSEEIFFRGFLVKKIGVLGASIIFGLAHFTYGSIIEILGAFILGLLLAKAFEENKNIIPNITAHFIYNLLFLSAIL